MAEVEGSPTVLDTPPTKEPAPSGGSLTPAARWTRDVAWAAAGATLLDALDVRRQAAAAVVGAGTTGHGAAGVDATGSGKGKGWLGRLLVAGRRFAVVLVALRLFFGAPAVPQSPTSPPPSPPYLTPAHSLLPPRTSLTSRTSRSAAAVPLRPLPAWRRWARAVAVQLRRCKRPLMLVAATLGPWLFLAAVSLWQSMGGWGRGGGTARMWVGAPPHTWAQPCAITLRASLRKRVAHASTWLLVKGPYPPFPHIILQPSCRPRCSLALSALSATPGCRGGGLVDRWHPASLPSPDPGCLGERADAGLCYIQVSCNG